MAASRPNVQVLIPTVLGAGTAVVCALPGTVTQAGAANQGGTNPYFLLQKGFIGFQSVAASAAVYALRNGTAVAAGTVALLVCQPNFSTPFDLTVGAQEYAGVKIDQPGGLAIAPTTDRANHGTISGTVSAMVLIKDILQ